MTDSSPTPRLTLRRGVGILREHVRESRAALAAVVALSVIGAVASLVQPLLVNRIIDSVGADSALTSFIVGLVAALGGALIIVGSAAAMIWYDPVLFAVALAVLTGAAITVAAASGKIQELARRVSESTGAMSSGVERALSAIVAVRTAGATESEAAALKDDADRAWRASLRSVRLEAFLWPMSGLAIQVAFLMVLGLGGARVAAGELSVANLMAYLMFLFMLMMPIGQLFGAVTSVAAALGALARIDQVMAEPTEDAADSPVPGTAPDLSGAVPAVGFDDVVFSHDEEQGHAGHAPGPGVPDSPYDRVLDGVFFAADADDIVVVDAGQVRATGTHAELMESSALYRDLARDQLLS